MGAGALAWTGAIVMVVLTLREPPSWAAVTGMAAAGLAGLMMAPRGWRWPAAGLLGAAWALASAAWLSAHELGPAAAGEVRMVGQVVGIPQVRADHTLFELRPEKVLDGPVARPLPRRVRLRWYGDPPNLRPGERWQLSLQLRPPEGFLNPAGFDYQSWLFQRRLGATGYVRDPATAERLGATRTVASVRSAIAERMAEHLSQSPRLGLIQGLGIAVRDRIDEAQWEILSVTGTAHLLAISGLHIGLVAGAAGGAASWVWRRIPPLVRRVPALTAGTLAGGAAATGYAVLAGLTLPTQRALLTVLVFAGALLLRRPLSSWHSLALAAAGVLLLDPWAPLGPGFWLSFGAVAVILAATTGRLPARGPGPWLRIQALVGVGLMPATALSFGHLALLSPLANLFAVPWVSLLVVPTVLAGIAALPFSEVLAAILWQAADQALRGLMAVLEALAQTWGAIEVPEPPPAQVLLASLGIFLLLTPRGVPGRVLALPLLGLLLLGPAARPGEGERVVVFDTGAGLTALVTDGQEGVIYGGGPGGSLDAVSVAVIPYLQAQGIEPIAWIVPRAETPWNGAVEQAKARWPGLTWIEDESRRWSITLSGLQLQTACNDEPDCTLRITKDTMPQALALRPELPAQVSAPTIGTVDCDEDAKGQCTAALALPDQNLLRTQEYGAITLKPDASRWQVQTEWARRGRIYHRSPQASEAQ